MRVVHAHGSEQQYCSEMCARGDCPGRAEPFAIENIERELRKDDYYARTLYASDMEVKKIVLREAQDIPGETHENSAQAFIVTEGRARFVIGCGLESSEIGEGGLYIVPRNTHHRVVNVSGGTTRILSMYQNRQHPVGLVYKQRGDAL